MELEKKTKIKSTGYLALSAREQLGINLKKGWNWEKKTKIKSTGYLALSARVLPFLYLFIIIALFLKTSS